VTQRGNRRQPTFFGDDDYRQYLAIMREWCDWQGVEIWGYCLMPNHVHLIAVPEREDSLAKAIGEAHRRYTRYINFREGWRGYLWQGRFASHPMDEPYLLAAARYIELNPVRAGLVRRPGDYTWSSAPAHLQGRDDRLLKRRPLLDLVDDWAGFLSIDQAEEEVLALRRHLRTGRPLGGEGFILKLETSLNRRLRRQKPGPKRTN
jgi:putative transposase